MTKKERANLKVGDKLYKPGYISGSGIAVYEHEVIGKADNGCVMINDTTIGYAFYMSEVDRRDLYLDRNVALEKFKAKVAGKLLTLNAEVEYYKKMLDDAK